MQSQISKSFYPFDYSGAPPIIYYWKKISTFDGNYDDEEESLLSLVDEGWYRLTTVLNFGIFNRPVKRIQTPHRLFRHIRADKTLTTSWSGAEFKFESKFKPLPIIWQLLPKAIPEEQSKVLTAKSNAKLLWQRSCTAWAGQTGMHKHRVTMRVFSSRLQTAVATCRDRLSGPRGKRAISLAILTQF